MAPGFGSSKMIGMVEAWRQDDKVHFLCALQLQGNTFFGYWASIPSSI